ncbi:MAG: cache domain-containing protein [Gammaproteobacteria bacterium]|nr:cache domain-containing protein [Gammaproteobacteria bacterium]
MQFLLKHKKRIAPTLFCLVFILTSAVVYQKMFSKAVESTKSDLMLFRDLRQSKLESYFDTLRAEITFWSGNGEVRLLLEAMNEAWAKLGDEATLNLQKKYIDKSLDGSSDDTDYDHLHSAAHTIFSKFQKNRGYYDVFLIDVKGHVIYSIEKEPDFATNLVDGRWKDTSLGKVFRAAINNKKQQAVEFSDFSSYEPSQGKPALFVASKISDIDGELMGALVFQVPNQAINKIMQVTTGMGETGETYIVGKDFLMRSQSRFYKTSSVLKIRVETEPVKRAFKGETGALEALDYRDIDVFSAYGSFKFDKTTWAVLAEIDSDEVLQPVMQRFLYCIAGVFLLMLLVSVLLFISFRWVLR